MECAHCGAEVPAGARFCPTCGHALGEDAGDERRVVTVLFADIVGFTSMSETLDPERVKLLVDSWFQRLVADITEFGGRVDKIVGDGILALFGAPVAHEDDADRAVRAALRMQESLASMSERAAGVSGSASTRVQMRIGVNTGEVLVGALRAGGATTAMGDVVNTASRLQTAARPGEVLVGPTTHSLTAHSIAYERRGLLTARGRDEPVEAWSATRALVPPGQRPARDHIRLVGRTRELSLLDAAVATAFGHSRALLGLVVGDTGVGKTRLVQEAARRLAAGRDVLVLDGRCVPYGEANVWWPLAEALNSVSEVDPGQDFEAVGAAVWAQVAAALGDDATDAELDRVSRGLLELMGHGCNTCDREPARTREEAVSAFVTFIEGHASRRPVVLLLSDIHWADRDLLDLVEQLVTQLARCPLVVLATARQVVRETWAPPPGRHDTVVVNLDPLDPGAAEEMLVALHGGAVPDEVRDVVLARSGGNPFFLEELVSLIDSGGAAADGLGLPETLRGIVAARLDTLDADERAVLTDAAVIGRRGPIGALREMSVGMGRDLDVEAAVETLAAHELLEVEGRMWEFRSEIAREVAYATLSKSDRARRHAGIAAWVEERALVDLGGRVALADRGVEEKLAAAVELDDHTVNRVARHWASAAELVAEMGELPNVPPHSCDRAVVWLWASALRAQRRDLLPAADRAYTRALDLAGSDPVGRRIRLLVNRARVRSERWNLDAARDDAQAALDGALASGDRAVEASAILRLGDIDQRAGDLDAALTRLRQAADRYAADGDDAGRGEALRLLGLTQMFAGRMVEAAASVQEARDAFGIVEDDAGLGWAAQNLAWIAFLTADLDTCEAEVARAMEHFERIDDHVGHAWARGLLAFVRFAQGRRPEAERLVLSTLGASDDRGDRWATGMMRGLLGSLRLWDGRVADALVETRAATTLLRDLGDRWGLAVTLGTHARALAMIGDVAEGFAVLEEPEPLSDHPFDPMRMARLALAVQIGEPERAADVLEGLEHQDLVTGMGLAENDSTVVLSMLQRGVLPPVPDGGGRAYGLAVRAMVAAAAGNLETALTAADSIEDCVEQTFLDRTTGEVAAGLALVRAGRVEEGSARLDAATKIAGSTDDRVAQAMVFLARAVAAESAGGPSAVSDRTDAAIALARLDLTAEGWETAFLLAVGRHPHAEVG